MQILYDLFTERGVVSYWYAFVAFVARIIIIITTMCGTRE